jgi:NADH-quinone oxidoreductase subunit A
MLSEFLKDYLPIILFLIIALGLSCAFVVVNFILSPKKPDPEKLSAYECGFEPFEDSRMEFDVRFYLVAILFIIFDLEIAFLFPLGNLSWQYWHIRFFFNDDFFIHTYYWFYL